MGEARSTNRKNEKYIQNLCERPKRKRQSGRHKRRQKDSIKMYIKELGVKDINWIHLVQYTAQWRLL